MALVLVTLSLGQAVSGSRVSGWRAASRFDSVTATDGSELFGVEICLVDSPHIEPGATLLCVLRLWAADLLPARIEPGTHLTILEGAKQVATGVVLCFAEVASE